MKQIFRVAGIALIAMAAGPALAGKGGPPPPPTFTTVVIGQDREGEDEFFAGINWQFGTQSQAELVIGYRDVDVHSDGDVDGFGLDFTFPFKDGLKFGEMRLKGIEGEEDWQGEFGFGWSFLNDGFLLTGGVQGNYFTLGTDYVFGTGLEPYVGVNSIGSYDAPPFLTETTASCPEPYVVSQDGQSCEFGNQDADF
jgi:hypothetical protein